MTNPWFDQGGPAFPFKLHGLNGKPPNYYPGMTLRDWFAGQAMAAVMSTGGKDNGYIPAIMAIDCYALADAMLAERAKEPKP